MVDNWRLLKRRNNAAWLAAVVLAVTLGPAFPCRAQIGACTTLFGQPCASQPQQILEYARQALQLENEITTAAKEVLNTLSVPGQLYQSGAGVVHQIVGLASQAQLTLGNTGNFIGNLNASYYPLPLNAMPQIIAEQNAIGNAIQQLGNVIGVVNPQLASRSDIVDAIQSESLGDAGRMQVMQDAHQLAASTAQDMHSLVNLTLSMAQGQHATLLAEHDRKAMEDAMMDQFSTNYQPFPTGGWKGF